MRHAYPFSAIVGQADMKHALLMAAIDPSIGGVLVFGERGTGKSTAVRGLSALLPPNVVVKGCRYGCDPAGNGSRCSECHARVANGTRLVSMRAPAPVVDLPLGASEDRIVGTIDLERALLSGERRYEPGLLARAHRGFLYIDEVNLLEDHLVDLLLDVAATGENVVEREGLSVRHPARFVLVGSCNPEEGELRPQLLDRFGLAVEIATPTDIAERVEIVRRRDAFERDAAAFVELWQRADRAVQRRVLQARARVGAVIVPDEVLTRAATLCQSLGTDGVRGELTLMRSMRAFAAYEGAPEVTLRHLRAVAGPCLGHRLRRDPLDDVRSMVRVERAVGELLGA